MGACLASSKPASPRRPHSSITESGMPDSANSKRQRQRQRGRGKDKDTPNWITELQPTMGRGQRRAGSPGVHSGKTSVPPTPGQASRTACTTTRQSSTRFSSHTLCCRPPTYCLFIYTPRYIHTYFTRSRYRPSRPNPWVGPRSLARCQHPHAAPASFVCHGRLAWPLHTTDSSARSAPRVLGSDKDQQGSPYARARIGNTKMDASGAASLELPWRPAHNFTPPCQATGPSSEERHTAHQRLPNKVH